MLKQCLKQDFKAFVRLWWIIALSMTGAGLVSACGFRFFFQLIASENPPASLSLLSVLAMIVSFLCILVLIIGVAGTYILIYWRMYSHFYTDEGYLTFTLPAKRSTLYLSKVLAGAAIDVATILVLLFNIALIALVAVPTTDGGILNPIVFEYVGQAIATVWNAVGAWTILWGLLIFVFFVVLGLCSSGLTYLCITIGAIVAKKHKLLAGIGIYYLVSSIMSFVGQIFTMFTSAGAMVALMVGIGTGGLTMSLTITITLLIAILIAACVAMLYHFMTMERLEKKLNLA